MLGKRMCLLRVRDSDLNALGRLRGFRFCLVDLEEKFGRRVPENFFGRGGIFGRVYDVKEDNVVEEQKNEKTIKNVDE